MKKLFSALLLYFICAAALADNNTQHLAGFMSTPAVVNHTDLSLTYLGQLFGSVGGVLSGTNGQMLGHLFYRLNQGLLIVAAVWIFYTTATVLLRASNDGSFMGPNKNVSFVVLKIAIGIGLLLPNPATGYSIFQDGVMMVVVEGVGLADQTWNYALNYLKGGGEVYMTSASGTNTLTKNSATTNAFYNSSNAVFSDEVCMLASENYESTYNKQQQGSGSGVVVNHSPLSYNVVFDSADGVIAFPGVGDHRPYNASSDGCGKVSSLSLSGGSSAANSAGQVVNRQTYAALRQMVLDDLPAARRYVCANDNSINCLGVSSVNIAKQNQQNFFSSVLDYNNLILPYAQYLQRTAKQAVKNFYNAAGSAGWVTAGRYYWDISELSSEAQASAGANMAPYFSASPTVSQPHVKSLYTTAQTSTTLHTDFANHVQTMIGQYNGANSTNGGANSGGQSVTSSVGGFAGAILNSMFGPMVGLTNDFKDMQAHDGNGNPIIWFHNLGRDMINTAVEIWLIGSVMIVGVGLGAGVCAAVIPLATVFNSIVSWVKPIIMTIAGLLFMPGFILGYYVPLYPWILFTFGIVGWLMAVLEAMVAAPLVCFGLTHPEGHDYLGRAEQALILLLGVFLRPVLMVIGLLAGMTLSFVAFKVVAYGFANVVLDAFSTTTSSSATVSSAISAAQSSSNGLASLVVVVSLMVVFGFIVFVITNQCYSLIHVLPNNILMWIGGQPKQDQTAQAMQQIQGGAMSSAKQGGDMASSAQVGGFENLGKAIGGRQANKNQKKQRRVRLSGNTK